MKVPISWLKQYVSFEDSLENFVDTLTFSGLEVEAVETIGGQLDDRVVAGRVTAVDAHPNADKLRLCTVEDGSDEHRVVCGAPNVEVGGVYPFAPVGVTLPNGMKLKKAKIRGEVSLGMLCAEDELGLSDSHEGLMELDRNLAPGTPMNEVLGPPETVLELEVTPNRPDCLSMIGIAREVAALYGTDLKRPDVSLTETGDPADQDVTVTVANPEACPVYTARLLEGVTIGPAPEWMQRALTLAGIRPINNVVDITNYVMLETGQPLHAFDFDLVRGARIEVRSAADGETMSTLDEVERTLDSAMLLICDGEGPVALAGVMGGGGSEIQDETSRVLLESACFEPDGVRATSAKIGLKTDSSYRFERGVDPGGADWASRRAAQLMIDHAGATLRPGVVYQGPLEAASGSLTCRYQAARDLVGIDFAPDDIHRVFASLDLQVLESNDESVTISIPSFRGDLVREVDLIEEIARVHGLDQIPAPPPMARLIPGSDATATVALDSFRAQLVGLGLRETMHYSLLSPGLLDLVQADDPKQRVLMPHPLSQDQSILRSSLLPQMGETLARNHARQLRSAGLFEIGRTYQRGEGAGEVIETRCVSIGLMGPVLRTGIDTRTPVTEEEMFLSLKGIWEELARLQKQADYTLTPKPMAVFESGYAIEIQRNGQPVGRFGLLQTAARSKWRFQEPVGLLELKLDGFINHTFGNVNLQPVPAYPATSRDIALVVDDSVKNEDILSIVAKVAPKELENVELFDIFSGEGIGAGKKSLAYSFRYRSSERTLTDDDANQYHESVRDALLAGLPAELRD